MRRALCLVSVALAGCLTREPLAPPGGTGGTAAASPPPLPRLAAGNSHSCAVRADGALWCWGDGLTGELGNGSEAARGVAAPVGETADWLSISSGMFHADLVCGLTGGNQAYPCGTRTCGIRADGTLWCWGDIANTGPLPPPSAADGRVGDAADWARVSVGGGGACALKRDGTLWCWGGREVYGFGAVVDVGGLLPARVGAASDWREVSVGNGMSCGLRGDGLWCWASSPYVTNNAVALEPPSPQRVAGAADWVAVSAGTAGAVGTRPACGVRGDGGLWCWSWKAAQTNGQGTPELTMMPPVRIGGDARWSAVSVGGDHTCAVRADGALACLDADGAPVALGDETDWVAVRAGRAHVCARRRDDSVACWGNNLFGQLGRGTTGLALQPRLADGERWAALGAASGLRADGTLWYWYNEPRSLSADSRFTALADGGVYACALRAGAAFCWHHDPTLGLLADPELNGGSVPWRQVAAGYHHGCGIRADGSLWCWGTNDYGELGDGTREDRPSPIQVGGGTDWTVVRAHTLYTCGIEAPGSLWCWGDNRGGTLGDGTRVQRLVPTRVGTGEDWLDVAPGVTETCALRQDHTLWCWGASRLLAPGQLGGDADWSRISVGDYHKCGIRGGGALYCWGANTDGQVGDGPTYSAAPVAVAGDWVDVAASGASTCALTREGVRWCWGRNVDGELGDGRSWSDVPVAVGF